MGAAKRLQQRIRGEKEWRGETSINQNPIPCHHHTAKGFNPRAEMLRWFRRDQDGFEKVYHQRSLVESVFSSMKERFGSVVAAKTLPMQRLQVILRNICYNLVA